MTPALSEKVLEVIKARGVKAPRVLEIGSMDINGSVRPHFMQHAGTTEYIGVDQEAGKGVDVVATSEKYFRDFMFDAIEHFDAIVCLEVIEHDPRFWKTLEFIFQMLKPGGYLFLSAPTYGFPYHPFPKDYYRFSSDAFREVLMAPYEDVGLAKLKDPNGDPTLFAIGRKPKRE